jgi:heterotetrameric sarcosine oxidase gamma subunit
MAEAALAAGRCSVPGLEVGDDPRVHIATLRYFEPRGAFADAVQAATGVALPAPLAATSAALPGAPQRAALVLAWLRPTETLVLTADTIALRALMARLGSAAGGHVLDLSGSLQVLRLAGARVSDLLARLGSAGMPAVGEARRGRLADVPALALSVRAGEVLLAVDRAHAAHLLEWVGATLADW